MHAGPLPPDLAQRPGVRRLAGVPLLAACSAAELASIAPLLRTERFDAGDEVVSAGRRDGRFWIVVEGEAVVAAGGSEVGRLCPGDHYGEVGLLDGDPEPATVTAVSPVLVFTCGPAGFDHILATAPGARSRVLVTASRRRLAHRLADAIPLPPLPHVVAREEPSARRRLLLSTAASLAVVLLGVGAWFVSQRNHTTTFGLGDALDALHARTNRPSEPAVSSVASGAAAVAGDTARRAPAVTATPGPSSSPIPAPAMVVAGTPAAPAPFDVPAAGVYAYATSGSDAISMGSRHQYPAETYAVLTHDGGCGWEVDHHVVDQHVDHVVRCSRPGDVLRVSDASRVTFFGQTDGLTYVCDPPVSMLGADATCSAADGSQARYHTTIVDRPTVNVGGIERAAIHVVLSVTMTGRANGTARNELWLDAATGLILHQIRDVDTHAHAAFGDVRYTEHAEFVLESLTARQ
jgi:CRP-like cAMP-binding protein